MSAALPVLTKESILALGPCRDWREYLGGRESVPLDEVLLDADRRRISEADQRWLVAQLLDRVLAYRWMHVFVERAIRRSLGRTGCHEWEEWATRWLSGEDRSDAAASAWALRADAAAWAETWTPRAAAATWAAWAAAEVWASRAEAAAWAAWAAAGGAKEEEHLLQMQDAIRLLGGA